MRQDKVSYEKVAAVLDRQAGWPYAERGHRALPLVDPRRESWLESFSFVTLHQMGLPMPEPQVSLLDARARFVGRVDGWLEDEAVGSPGAVFARIAAARRRGGRGRFHGPHGIPACACLAPADTTPRKLTGFP